jgi:hypothetical protein
MRKAKARAAVPAGTLVRCAVYTHKSTEEGLDQEFNTLDAQREAGGALQGQEYLADSHWPGLVLSQPGDCPVVGAEI